MSVTVIIIIILSALLFLSAVGNVLQAINTLAIQEELDMYTHGLDPVYLVAGPSEEE